MHLKDILVSFLALRIQSNHFNLFKKVNSCEKNESKFPSTVPVCEGLSSDGRTNRWRIVCPKCGATFRPATTMFSVQTLTCPKAKCGASMVAKYNDDVVHL